MSKRKGRNDEESETEISVKRRRNVEEKVKFEENRDDLNTQCSSSSLIRSFSQVPTKQISFKEAQESILKNLRSGKIRKIILKNFMCHRNFEVDLNSNINVFVGDNGSGKSAILAALAIGLGSKASSTSRSTSLKELVRYGEPSASIEIVLSNDGIDSFEREVYGDEITVIRTISASGTSAYKMKNESGRIVSSTRADLFKMTLCLNIQVENPVLLLNQDAARSFLKECDPKKLYQLFLKATQIESIIEKLNGCFQSASNSKTRLENIKKSIKFLSTEVSHLNDKYMQLKSVEALRVEIDQYKNQLGWLRVSKEERELRSCEEDVNKKKGEIAELNEFLKNRKKHEDQLKEQIAELEQISADKQKIFSERNSEIQRRQQAISQAQEKLDVSERSIKKAQDRKKRVDNDIKQLESDISELEKNQFTNQKRENEARLAELKNSIKDVQSMMESAKRDIQLLLDTVESNKERLAELQNKQKQVRNEISKITNQINQIDVSTKDALSVYGRSMPGLIAKLTEMTNAGKFSKMPRGPLGQYIEIPNKRYRNAIEFILGPKIHSFYVNCDKDRILLDNLVKRNFPDLRFTIITGQFNERLYDLRSGMCHPPQNAQLLMNLMKVRDPVVMNCLIDQVGLETILITEDMNVAIHLTSEEHNVPNNMRRVLLLNPFSEYYPAPNYRSYSLQNKPARYLQVDMKEIKLQLENEKQQIEMHYHEIGKEIAEFMDQLKQNERLLREKQQNHSKINVKNNKMITEIKEIESIEYPDENETEYIQEEMDKLQKVRLKAMKTMEEEENKKKEIEAEIKELEVALKEYKKSVRSNESEIHSVQQKIDVLKQKLGELNTNFKMKKNQIAQYQEELKDLEKIHDACKSKVDELIGHTQNERVQTTMSEEKLIDIIKKNERRITQIQSSNENIDEVKALYDEKNKHLGNMKEIGDKLEHTLKHLTAIRESRFRYVKKLKQHMSLKVKLKFFNLMNLRNYTAEVVISNQEKTLELKVIPRDATVEGAVSNTKSLSGGERSFSTVAFLIALWSCVDHPFYFMDEYDVFSDDYNRHIMTLLLLEEAKRKKDKQYGFLTPQDLTNIEASDLVTIHKLQDPKRC